MSTRRSAWLQSPERELGWGSSSRRADRCGGLGGGPPLIPESDGKQAEGQVSWESSQASCLGNAVYPLRGEGGSTLVGAGGSQRASSHQRLRLVGYVAHLCLYTELIEHS